MGIANAKVRSEFNSLLGLFGCLFIFALHGINETRKEGVGCPLTRISLCPRLAGLLRFFLVSCRPSIVISGDKELLVVAGTVPQFVGFSTVLRTKFGFAAGTVHEPERRVCDGKLGIDLDGMFKKRNSGIPTRGGDNFPAHAISL